MEFSKKITAVSLFNCFGQTILLILFPVFHVPFDGLLISVGCAYALATLTVTFYLKKAAMENNSKYFQRFISKYAKEYSIDTAIQIATAVSNSQIQ